MDSSIRISTEGRAPSALARVVLGTLILLVPACHIPTLRTPETGPSMPASFDVATGAPADPTATPESSSKLDVHEFFKDPALTGLIDLALASNLELKILDEEVLIASNEVLARRGAYLPFVTVGARAGLEKPSRFTNQGAVEDQLEVAPGQPFPDPLPNFLGVLNVTWALDIWRELRNARDAATQRYLSAVERRNYFTTRLVAEVAEHYYDLMALDKRMETLNKTIELQEKSLELAKARKEAGRDTELAVQRFQAEVRRNQSEKLIVQQEIVEAENRINFLVNRYPQAVERSTTDFFDLTLHALNAGMPVQLLWNRADIRQAERELLAAGLDVQVARAHFFPKLDLEAGVGYQAFNMKYLFYSPEALVYGVAGNLVAPLINKKAIRAEYMSANDKQLQCVYNYQRVVLNAFTEVVNRLSMVENYRKSLEIKKQQLESLQASVTTATQLFQNARTEYVEVLLAQRDMLEARMVLIATKKQQLAAVVNAYQALGGGMQPHAHSACDQPHSDGKLP